MNSQEQNLTPTDLVYLFVDGEASDLEQTLLFQALAADAELQAELADAIRINSAAQQERLETLPPVAVTAALFEKIGSSRPIPTSAPPVLLPATGVSSMVSPDRPPLQNQRREEEPERKRRLGAFLMPLAAGALGALLTLVIVGDPFGTGR